MEHSIRWFAVSTDATGARIRIPRNRHMRGTWGWDAVCTCGWDSRTGGALEREVRRQVADHKADVAYAAQQPSA